jgi:hypothetical protein
VARAPSEEPETTCPSCDAPAPARGRSCARCGYRFVEDVAAPARLPRPSRRVVAATLGGGALAAVTLTAVALRGAETEDPAAADAPREGQLEVISKRPLTTLAAERLLIERYLAVPDDDETDVRCDRREPRPAHSVRRCHILYPGGTERTVVVVTNANGSEVLSEP